MKNIYDEIKNKLEIDLKNASPHECILYLHKYLGCLHQGILTKNLGIIEYTYEHAQTILEIYYSKL